MTGAELVFLLMAGVGAIATAFACFYALACFIALFLKDLTK